MTIVTTRRNEARWQPVLTSMHADRKRVFVDRLGWGLAVTDDAYEIDEFDTESAIYVIAVDPKSQRHLGSVRLLPTTTPHLMDSIFPELCEGPIPVGPDVWEISRICTAPDVKGERAAQVRRELTLAFVHLALANGVTRLTAACHMQFLSVILGLGWNCTPLGLPKEIQGQLVGALVIDLDIETPDILGRVFAERAALAAINNAA